jgi:hypothetical protein
MTALTPRRPLGILPPPPAQTYFLERCPDHDFYGDPNLHTLVDIVMLTMAVASGWTFKVIAI